MYRSMGKLAEDLKVIMHKPNDNFDTFVFAYFLLPIHTFDHASMFVEFIS
jgi:hypothetical protein